MTTALLEEFNCKINEIFAEKACPLEENELIVLLSAKLLHYGKLSSCRLLISRRAACKRTTSCADKEAASKLE